jgi:hypothetical protein
MNYVIQTAKVGNYIRPNVPWDGKSRDMEFTISGRSDDLLQRICMNTELILQNSELGEDFGTVRSRFQTHFHHGFEERQLAHCVARTELLEHPLFNEYYSPPTGELCSIIVMKRELLLQKSKSSKYSKTVSSADTVISLRILSRTLRTKRATGAGIFNLGFYGFYENTYYHYFLET